MNKGEQLIDEGVILKRAGKYKEAKDKYIQSIKINKENPMAYYSLGKVLYILGEFDSSVIAYKVALDLGATPENTLIHLGHSLLDKTVENNEFEDVIKYYNMSINPYVVDSVNRDSELKNFSHELLEEYNNKCICTAKEYYNNESHK